MKNTEEFVKACRETFLYDPSVSSYLRRRVRHRENPEKPTSAYRMVDVTVNGKRYTEYVHRIIWMLHYGVIPEGMVIDHIDRDKLNNSLDNLRVVTKLENNLNCERKIVTHGKGPPRKWKKGTLVIKPSATFKGRSAVFVEYNDGSVVHVGNAKSELQLKALRSEVRQKGLLRVRI